MTTKNNPLPPSLVANLQNVLAGRKVEGEDKGDPTTTAPPPSTGEPKPVVLVTNGDGIGAPGLTALVDALVRDGRFDVHVCAPESDKSLAGHSMTTGETVVASSTEINGATAFEISGTPADCVSLALSGALFSWARPTLVISGIDRGSNCGHHMASRLHSRVCGGQTHAGKLFLGTGILLCPSIKALASNLHSSAEMLPQLVPLAALTLKERR